MGEILTFTPRQRPPELAAPVPLAGTSLRLHLEEAAQTALDAADKIIAALDRIDDDTVSFIRPDVMAASAPLKADDHQAADALAEGLDSMAEASAIMLPEPVDPVHEVIPVPPLRWGGRGNIVAAAGVALVDLVARREVVAAP